MIFKKKETEINDGALKGTASVGSFPEGASFYGCMGMAGNAWEWCIDAMDRHYYKKAPDYDVGGAVIIVVRQRFSRWATYLSGKSIKVNLPAFKPFGTAQCRY